MHNATPNRRFTGSLAQTTHQTKRTLRHQTRYGRYPFFNRHTGTGQRQAGFQQRRKTLRNSLKALIKSDEIKELEIFNKRPEQLSVDAFINITNILEQ